MYEGKGREGKGMKKAATRDKAVKIGCDDRNPE